MTKNDAWLLEIAKIPQDLREPEPELLTRRWFDYRDLMPAQLTSLFANRYEVAYREAYARIMDARASENVSPLMGRDVFESPELLPIWRARQAADQIGCKYDFYLNFAFKRFFERGWRYMPRPNQLYGEELILDANEAWQETTRASLQLANRKRFLPEQYVGHPDQDAYYAYLVQQVAQREHRHMVLSRLVFREKILPLAVASEHFSADDLTRAESFATR